MKTLINALLIGSLMTTVAFAGDPAPKADKTAPAKKDDKATAPATDKTAPATDAKATDKTAPKTDAKKDVKAPATK
jgi:serine protease inhibitor ecotin